MIDKNGGVLALTSGALAVTERDENRDQAQREKREQAPRKFELPPNCVDVTAESVGEVIAVIGPARQFRSAASKPRPG